MNVVSTSIGQAVAIETFRISSGSNLGYPGLYKSAAADAFDNVVMGVMVQKGLNGIRPKPMRVERAKKFVYIDVVDIHLHTYSSLLILLISINVLVLPLLI